MNLLSLFAGIGGIDLGFESAGIDTVAQVEIDPYCQRVLARHWPEVPRHDDVRTFPEWWILEGGPRPVIDVVAAGFPCQPFSLAGKQLGTSDERWMWPEVVRALRAVRPFYVFLENVAALVRDRRAFGTVLADLHRLGFDAEWATLSATEFGAPTPRQRVYLLAYAPCVDGRPHDRLVTRGGRRSPIAARGLSGLALPARRRAAHAWLEREPRVDRLAHGIPAQSHRLRVIGNAVIPAIAEHIGHLIVEDAATLAIAESLEAAR